MSINWVSKNDMCPFLWVQFRGFSLLSLTTYHLLLTTYHLLLTTYHLLKALSQTIVIGLNFLLLKELFENPLVCFCRRSPLKKGIISHNSQFSVFTFHHSQIPNSSLLIPLLLFCSVALLLCRSVALSLCCSVACIYNL